LVVLLCARLAELGRLDGALLLLDGHEHLHRPVDVSAVLGDEMCFLVEFLDALVPDCARDAHQERHDQKRHHKFRSEIQFVKSERLCEPHTCRYDCSGFSVADNRLTARRGPGLTV